MLADSLRDLATPVADLHPLPGNPRRGDVAAVARSLKRFGQRKPIVARRDGTVVAGNHTLQAAVSLGWKDIAVVWVDEDEATSKAYALADNRTSALGVFDPADLSAMVAEVYAVDPELLLAASYDGADLDALPTSPATDSVDHDDAPEPPATPVSVLGDLWHLGPHRLLCGDATNPDDVARVTADTGPPGIVYTDPPYGIRAVPKDGGVSRGGPFGGVKAAGPAAMRIPAQRYAAVTGDDGTATAADAFALLTTEYPAARHVWWGGNHYAASAGLPDGSCWLVWDKDNGGSDFADAELAWTNHPGAVRLLRHMWNGMLRASERGKRVHPTQKPIALAQWALGVVDPKNERQVVLDVFAGSGSTLIAAHATGRVAATIELEPAYVDVICRRYQETTGVVPVLESTGRPHSFLQEA